MRIFLTVFGLLVPIFAHAANFRSLSIGQKVEIARIETLRCLTVEVCASSKHSFAHGSIRQKPSVDLGWKDWPELMPSITLYDDVPATIISLDHIKSRDAGGFDWVVYRVGVLIGNQIYFIANSTFVRAGISQYEGQNDRNVREAFDRIADFPGIRPLPVTPSK